MDQVEIPRNDFIALHRRFGPSKVVACLIELLGGQSRLVVVPQPQARHHLGKRGPKGRVYSASCAEISLHHDGGVIHAFSVLGRTPPEACKAYFNHLLAPMMILSSEARAALVRDVYVAFHPLSPSGRGGAHPRGAMMAPKRLVFI